MRQCEPDRVVDAGQVSRRRIDRLMRGAGLAGKTKRKFKATTHSKHNLAVTDKHLDRQFAAHQPDQVYAGDITTIYTQEGWLYWAVIIDLISRQVVSGSMNGDMRATLVNDALLMRLGSGKPDKGLLWRSDRGSQWASNCHRQLLKRFASRQSLSRKGSCWANAVSESFFHTLKTELTHHQTYVSREDAKPAVFEYIGVFYNYERLRSANGYQSPWILNGRIKLLALVSGEVLTQQSSPSFALEETELVYVLC